MFLGSSPLTRGKRGREKAKAEALRLIPAHAGKTEKMVLIPSQTPAHPRSRGENVRTLGGGRAVAGSSPLTRGKRGREKAKAEALRLIPAHAGKTEKMVLIPSQTPAHPRSRGENVRTLGGGRAVAGSSPLTRGKPNPRGQSPAGHRLIPAHAGKTSASRRTAASSTAHPRSRGENQVHSLTPAGAEGSSPLTRGKPRAR